MLTPALQLPSLRFFDTAALAFNPVFTGPNLRLSHRCYCWGSGMDGVFVGGIAALWGLLALMVWGFNKLEKPEGGRA